MKPNGFKPNGNFGQEASSPTTNFENINMYMVGVFVHANPGDGQPTQFARDIKFCWGLT